MILRDEVGRIIFSSCRQLFNSGDPLEAETRACAEGLRLALEWSDKPVLLELDSSVLIDAIGGRSQDRSCLAFLIKEIKDLIQGRRNISIVKVDREQNRASHSLANFARTDAKIAGWLGSGPEVLSQDLEHVLLVSPID
uniref:Uncharacterized protein n=1 Tax=Avena sativa TaxID=4498 RepID=A0ACD6A976_AVESA